MKRLTLQALLFAGLFALPAIGLKDVSAQTTELQSEAITEEEAYSLYDLLAIAKAEPADSPLAGFYQGVLHQQKAKSHLQNVSCVFTNGAPLREAIWLIKQNGRNVELLTGPEQVPFTGRIFRNRISLSKTLFDDAQNVKRSLKIKARKKNNRLKVRYVERVSSASRKLCTFVERGAMEQY